MSSRGISYLFDTSVSLRSEAFRVRELKKSGFASRAKPPRKPQYATTLGDLKRFEETKTLLRQTLPVARRVLGESHELTLRMRWAYAIALKDDPPRSTISARP